MSDQKDPSSSNQNVSGFLGLAAIILLFISFFARPEEARICEDENGFDYITATCQHKVLLGTFFSPSYCSVSYRTEGGRRISSFREPAKTVGTEYHFAALQMMTSDPDYSVFESRNPLFVKVDFENYTISTKGAFSRTFRNCRRGDY